MGIVAEEAVRILGVSQDHAQMLGDEIATRFSSEFGGEMTYIPKRRILNTSELHRRIYDAFTGDNHAELARLFKISVIHVYRVLSREAERERVSRQRSLPGFQG